MPAAQGVYDEVQPDGEVDVPRVQLQLDGPDGVAEVPEDERAGVVGDARRRG
jgi:hypothetical protein